MARDAGLTMVECGISVKSYARFVVPALGLALASPAVSQTAVPSAQPTATAVVAQSELFQVDQRNPVDNPTGTYFNGLPLPNLGYSLRASLLSAYDSNYRRLPDDVPAPNGRSSFRFTPLLSGTVNMPLGRQSLFATALVGKDFYVANSDYDRQRLAFSGGANLAAGSSCTGSLTGSWVQAQSNPNSNVTSPIVGNIPNTQTTSSFGASASCGGISGFTPTVSYRYAKSTNEGTRSFADLNSNSYSASLGYARPTLGVLSVFGTLSDNSYPKQSIGSFTRSVAITNLGVQYSRSLTTRFSANGSLSHVNINPNAPNQPSTGSLGYGLTLNYTPPSRFSASINATQNASSSPNTGTALYFVQTAFALNLAYQLKSTLAATLAVSTSERVYENQLGTIIDPNQITSDRLNRFRLSINWDPMRNTRASFFVVQQNRNGQTVSNAINIDYKDTTAGILISYGI